MEASIAITPVHCVDALRRLPSSGLRDDSNPMHEAREAPPSRVFDHPVVKSSKPAQITIVRDQGLHGAEHVFTILFNGDRIAALRQGEKVTVSAGPGTVFIEARMFNIGGKVPPVQVETTVPEGRSYVYRVGLDELTLRMLGDQSATRGD